MVDKRLVKAANTPIFRPSTSVLAEKAALVSLEDLDLVVALVKVVALAAAAAETALQQVVAEVALAVAVAAGQTTLLLLLGQAVLVAVAVAGHQAREAMEVLAVVVAADLTELADLVP